MRLHLLNDLHLEFAEFEPPPTAADVVVLAGDIGAKWHGIEWANQSFRVPVVYVLGNHEYYGERMDKVLRECRARAAPHVHVLDGDALTIDGWRFLGATLWTDFALYGAERCAAAIESAQNAMNDFRRIRVKSLAGFSKLTALASLGLHRRQRDWLEKAIAAGDPARTIVVSHHAPHRGSLAPYYVGDLLSPAFVSDLSPLLGTVPLWCHGHTHDSFDYRVGATRVLCNPRGYIPSEPNRAFDPGLCVEL